LPEERQVDRSVLTHFGACDGRFSDEQIVDVLRAAEEGAQSAAELCAAAGITLPMYCVWKGKYRGLTLEEVRAVRRRADRRARALLGGVLAIVIGLGAGGVGLLARTTWAVEPAPADTALAVQPAPVPDPAPAPAPEAPTLEVLPVARPPAPADEGYAVQVTAAPTLQEAEAMAGTLTAAGHPAYVLPIVVGTVEHFRVRVGPFASREAAEEAAGQLKRGGHPGAWVAR
jgi:cell division septation protein DedD